jgi:hypothetical protein
VVWVGFALGILDIYARITRPWRLVDAVARAGHPRFAEVVITHFAQFGKADPFGVSPNLGKDV